MSDKAEDLAQSIIANIPGYDMIDDRLEKPSVEKVMAL